MLLSIMWMVEIAKKCIDKYKGKRMTVWFNQSHRPFLSGKIFGHNVWDDVYLGRKSVEDAWNAYKDNLKLALRHADQLLDYLEGRIIITSDHEECFGEMGIFAHPQRVHIPPLIEVPYLVINK